jgi:hypothetical protein
MVRWRQMSFVRDIWIHTIPDALKRQQHHGTTTTTTTTTAAALAITVPVSNQNGYHLFNSYC